MCVLTVHHGAINVCHGFYQVVAAYMQGCAMFTPAVTRGFGLGQLETVLKAAMQSAGVEGQSSVLLIEDHHITSDDILETVNSLLSAGP